MADFDDVPYATMDKIGRTIDYFAGRNRYMGYLMNFWQKIHLEM